MAPHGVALPFVLLIFLASPVFGHVRLLFPPARTYQDELDNAYAAGPCGVERAADAVPTPLVAGEDVRVSWHLSYPHRGGFRINLLRPLVVNGTLWSGNGGLPGVNYEVHQLTTDDTPGVFGTSVNDTTAQDVTVQIPSNFPACSNCTLQLIRLAEDWAGSDGVTEYNFFSCADVRVVPVGDLTAPDLTGCLGCSGHGDCDVASHTCGCLVGDGKIPTGKYCETWDECRVDADCGPAHGRCVTVGSKYGQPNMQCYCETGWFGTNCAQASYLPLSASSNLEAEYEQHVMSDDGRFMLFYNVTGSEIEVALQVATDSWVAIGWRPETAGEATSEESEEEEEEEDEEEEEEEEDEEEEVEDRRHRHHHRRLQGLSGRLHRSLQEAGETEDKLGPYVNEMSSQDVTVAYARGNYFRIRDSWSRGEGTPLPDSYHAGTDDIIDANGIETGTHTLIKFRRRLVTGDSADWDLLPGTPMFLIYAFGQGTTVFGGAATITHDPATGAEGNVSAMSAFYRTDDLRYHGELNRGSLGTITLVEPITVDTVTNTTTGESQNSTSSTIKSSTTCVKSTLPGLDCQVSLRSGAYILHWRADDAGLSFGVDAATTGYVAVGFPKRRGVMVGGEAVIGWINADGSGAHVGAYSLRGETVSTVVLNSNIQLANTSVTRVGTRTLLQFTFPISTLTPSTARRRLLSLSVPVSLSSINNIILAYGVNPRLEDHKSNKGSASLNFFAPPETNTGGGGSTGGNSTSGGVEEDAGKEGDINYYRAHGALMVVGYGILIPSGSVIARFAKRWDPAWFHAHRVCQTLGLVIATIAFIISVNKFDVGLLDTKHGKVGLAAMILMWTQPLFGNKLLRPKKGARFRVEWEYLHIGTGRAGIVLAVVTTFFGFHRYENIFGTNKDVRWHSLM
eukprot:jgi/Mesvir1/14959/Mv14628-RA.2